MEPMINPGDTITILKRDFRNIHIGDIVVFKKRGQLFAHRVIAKKDRSVIAKGDNDVKNTELVTYRKIIGTAVCIDGKYGKLRLDSGKARLINYYFVLYSQILHLTYNISFHLVNSIFRGRRFLVSHILNS